MMQAGEELEVRIAHTYELDVVISILEDAARWMVSHGIEGWKPNSFSRQRIAGIVERDEMYLAMLADRAIGTFALQWSDTETWGRVPDDAGYIHGLAVCRDFAGMELGRKLLRWAENKASLSGRKYLRLDCVADNEALNQYYLRAGFGYRGKVTIRGLEVSLYEKRVGA